MSNPVQDPGDPRVYLAAERTLLAWVRTGLALMGFGFVVARFGLFLREIAAARADAAPVPERFGFSLAAGTAMILLGMVVNLVAALRYRRLIRQLRRGESPTDIVTIAGPVIAFLLAAVALAMAGYLLRLG